MFLFLKKVIYFKKHFLILHCPFWSVFNMQTCQPTVTQAVFMCQIYLCATCLNSFSCLHPHVFPMLPHYHHFNMTCRLLHSELSSKHLDKEQMLTFSIKTFTERKLNQFIWLMATVALGDHVVEKRFHFFIVISLSI